MKNKKEYNIIFEKYLKLATNGKFQSLHIITDENFHKSYNSISEECKNLINEEQFFYHRIESLPTSPFEPFLDMIKKNISIEDIDTLLKEAKVYHYHRRLFKNYFLCKKINRKEDIIIEEVKYEQFLLMESIVNLLSIISKKKPMVIVLTDFHHSSYYTLNVIKKLQENPTGFKILLLMISEEKFNQKEKSEEEIKIYEEVTKKNISAKITHPILKKNHKKRIIKNNIKEKNIAHLDINSVLKRLELLNKFLSFKDSITYTTYISEQQKPPYIAYIYLGDAFFYMKKYDHALNYYLKRLEKSMTVDYKLKIKTKDFKSISILSCRIAHTYINKHNLIMARRYIDQGIYYAQKSGNELLLTKALFIFFLIRYRDKTLLDIINNRKLFSLLKKHKLENTYCYCCENITGVQPYSEFLSKELAIANEAIEISKKKRNLFSLAALYHKKAIIYSYQNNHQESLVYLTRSEKLRKSFGDKPALIKTYNSMSYHFIQLEDYDNSFIYLSKTLKMLDHSYNYSEIAVTILNFAQLYMFTRNFPHAITSLKKLISLMNMIGIKRIPFQKLGDIYILKAFCKIKNNQFVQALDDIKLVDKHNFTDKGESRFFRLLISGILSAHENSPENTIIHFNRAKSSLDLQVVNNQQRLLPLFYLEFGKALKLLNKKTMADEILKEGLAESERLNYSNYKKWIKNEIKGIKSGNYYKLDKVTIDIDRLLKIEKPEAGGIIKLRKESVNNNIKQKIISAMEYLKANYSEEISREGLASMFDMNADYFGKMFKTVSGTSLKKYINTLRVETAMDKLLTSDLPIIDIAFSVGFGSMSNFYKTFLKHTGVKPQVFKKNQSTDNKSKIVKNLICQQRVQ